MQHIHPSSHSIGLLSYTFFRSTGKEDIVVLPMEVTNRPQAGVDGLLPKNSNLTLFFLLAVD
ncbi:hypothetical protein JHK87_031113 [Glycine soja]|nr:hypothetical protein JHK87_031113 [Glycine soja]